MDDENTAAMDSIMKFIDSRGDHQLFKKFVDDIVPLHQLYDEPPNVPMGWRCSELVDVALRHDHAEIAVMFSCYGGMNIFDHCYIECTENLCIERPEQGLRMVEQIIQQMSFADIPLNEKVFNARLCKYEILKFNIERHIQAAREIGSARCVKFFEEYRLAKPTLEVSPKQFAMMLRIV